MSGWLRPRTVTSAGSCRVGLGPGLAVGRPSAGTQRAYDPLLHRALAKQRQRRVLDHAAPLSLIGLNGGVTARQTLLAPTMRRLTA